MKIPIGDFKIGEEERKAINDVLDSGKITEGEKVKQFEEKWAKFIGTKYSVLLNSGTSALIAGLSALKYHESFKLKEKTKIITSPISYIATTNAIVLSGFEPVFVDIDKKTFCITPENIKKKLETADVENYSVILPVDLMGYSCDMNKINQLAKQYGLVTFEDASQAHGTIYENKKCGSLAHLSSFSFYIAHNIQAGELGAVNTNDLEIYQLIKQLKANGRFCDCPICTRKTHCPKISLLDEEEDFDPRFFHNLIGYNFKTMEFQAALALIQLKKIDSIIKKRQENVKYLNKNLQNFNDTLELPGYSDKVSYLGYPLVIKKSSKISRKKLRLRLERKGIETRPLFGCIPTQQPAYIYLREKYKNKLPNAEYVGKNGFYIGCHQYLTQEDLDYIIKVFKGILK